MFFWSTASVLKRTSLKFEHISNKDQETKTRKELEKKLLEICEGTKTGVSSETPRLFSDLVYIVRMVDSRTLSDTYKRIQDGAVCSENKDRVRLVTCTSLSGNLSFRTDRSGQAVQTQIRLLLEEQSDQGLYCLLFHLHHFDKIS